MKRAFPEITRLFHFGSKVTLLVVGRAGYFFGMADDANILLSLQDAAARLGPHVSVAALRAEVHAGRLKCIRVRPGANAKILLRKVDLDAWLEGHAARRQRAARLDK
jgi:hypothetical protein